MGSEINSSFAAFFELYLWAEYPGSKTLYNLQFLRKWSYISNVIEHILFIIGFEGIKSTMKFELNENVKILRIRVLRFKYYVKPSRRITLLAKRNDGVQLLAVAKQSIALPLHLIV